MYSLISKFRGLKISDRVATVANINPDVINKGGVSKRNFNSKIPKRHKEKTVKSSSVGPRLLVTRIFTNYPAKIEIIKRKDTNIYEIIP